VVSLKLNFIQRQKIKGDKSDEKNIYGLIDHFICICLQQGLDQKASARL